MRTADRDRIAARLAELEARTATANGARERVMARLAAYAEVLPPVPAHEAMVRLVAGLAVAGDSPGIVALRRAVARHG